MAARLAGHMPHMHQAAPQAQQQRAVLPMPPMTMMINQLAMAKAALPSSHAPRVRAILTASMDAGQDPVQMRDLLCTVQKSCLTCRLAQLMRKLPCIYTAVQVCTLPLRAASESRWSCALRTSSTILSKLISACGVI